MITKFITKLFNNFLGRLYLGVPKGKKIYKITKRSAHYYTGEYTKEGLPIISTGNCFSGRLKIFERFQFAGKFLGLVSVMVLTKFIGEHGLLPLFTLTDTTAKPPQSGKTGNVWDGDLTNPTNIYLDDGSYATCAVTSTTSYGYFYYNFGFGVWVGATIVGYIQNIRCYYTTDGATTAVSSGNGLVRVGTTYKGNLTLATADIPITTEGTITFGSTTEVPETPPTVAQVNDNSTNGICFGVGAGGTAGAGTATVRFDYMTVTIYYTGGTPPATNHFLGLLGIGS